MKTILGSALLLLTGIVLLLVPSGESIHCYVCNSHNDSACALANPPEMTKKDCSAQSDGSKYTMCRKIVQNIDFEVNGNPPDIRVIRGCGWDDSSYLDKCYQRSGFGGRQEVCSCTNADYCNGAGLQEVSYVAAFVAGALLLARFNI